MNDEPLLPKPLDDAVSRLRGDAAADVDVEAALQRVKARFGEAKVYELPTRKSIPERSSMGWRSNLIGLAAGIAVLAAGALVWRATQTGAGESVPMVAAQTFETGIGETDSLRLPDGTRVVMAPGSKLAFAADYGSKTRRVELFGEALFDVAHDDARPFSVLAGSATIRDIGTTFTVRHFRDANVEVAVTKGSVVLHRSDTQEREGVVLRAGDLGIFNRGLATLHRAAVTAADTAFVSGMLVFEETPMPAVAAELQRWYGITLRIDDPKIASQHITASFKGESVREVLNVIGLAIGVGIELHGDTAVARVQR
jgi:transmembrane sensor